MAKRKKKTAKGGNGRGNGKGQQFPGRPKKCEQAPYSKGCNKTRKRQGKTCSGCQAVL